MRIESPNAKTFTIFEPGGLLDPITVTLQDWGTGRGRLMVECYGWAWSCYWGAMGTHDLRSFLLACGGDYVAGKLTNNQRRATKTEERYLARIVDRVLYALANEETLTQGTERSKG